MSWKLMRHHLGTWAWWLTAQGQVDNLKQEDTTTLWGFLGTQAGKCLCHSQHKATISDFKEMFCCSTLSLMRREKEKILSSSIKFPKYWQGVSFVCSCSWGSWKFVFHWPVAGYYWLDIQKQILDYWEFVTVYGRQFGTATVGKKFALWASLDHYGKRLEVTESEAGMNYFYLIIWWHSYYLSVTDTFYIYIYIYKDIFISAIFGGSTGYSRSNNVFHIPYRIDIWLSGRKNAEINGRHKSDMSLKFKHMEEHSERREQNMENERKIHTGASWGMCSEPLCWRVTT